MSSVTDILLDCVDRYYEDMVEFTRELLAIPTENPPGNEYRLCAGAIQRKCEQLGLQTRVIEAAADGNPMPGYCVIASHGEGQRALYFHGHYDVVPRSSDEQFQPVIKGPNLFGRGSSDMKSGLAAMIYAVHAIRSARIRLNGRIVLTIVPDEETGGARGSQFLANAGVLGADGIGMLTAEPTSGVVWNASRGAISLRVTVKGKPAHVGLSCNGVNAFERMIDIVRELEKLKHEVEQRQTLFRIQPEAARRSILMMGGECRGGTNFNLVPERCSFTVDRRLNPEEDLETEKHRLTGLLQSLKESGIDHEFEIIQEAPPSGVPEFDPLSETLARTIEFVTGKPPSFEMCPGLLETRFYAERGIPAFAYGPGLLPVSHGPNEFVPLRNIRNCAAVYALFASAVLECIVETHAVMQASP